MLILSRRVDEALKIGDEVTVTVLSVKGKQVRLGIDAPDDISVHREEIYKRIKGEAATGTDSVDGETTDTDSTDSEITPQIGNE